MSAPNVGRFPKDPQRRPAKTLAPESTARSAGESKGAVRKAIRKLISFVHHPPGTGKLITRARWLGRRGFEDEMIQLEAEVDARGVPDGTAASFEVFTSEDHKSVEVIEAEVLRGRAVAEFTWDPEDEEPPPQVQHYFKVKVKGEEREASPIVFHGKGYFVRITIKRDLEDPETQDEFATLESSDGSYSQKQTWADGEEVENGVVLTFTQLEPGLKYNLRITPSKGEPYYAAKHVEAPKDRLKEHREGEKMEQKKKKKGKN